MGTRAILLIGAALLCAGCVSSTPLRGAGGPEDVAFVHPETGETWHCERPSWMKREALTAIAYSMCKTDAEKQGFRRVSP